jgi:hypothetical protein
MICILYNEAVSVLKILTSPGRPKEEHEIAHSKNTESNEVHKTNCCGQIKDTFNIMTEIKCSSWYSTSSLPENDTKSTPTPT